MTKKQQIFWSAAGFLMFLFIFTKVQNTFKEPQERTYQAVLGMYEEKKNTLDAVFIGASTVHYFWQPPLAWADYGIAVSSFSVNGLPVIPIKYWVMEARKTQPDALYIIALNGFRKTSISAPKIHCVADYMVPSLNKYQMIDQLCDDEKISLLHRMEFLFPIIRFHSRWSTLESIDFSKAPNHLKGGWYSEGLFLGINNLSQKYNIYTGENRPTVKKMNILSDFLDYCDREKVKVLFVNVPQAISSNKTLGQLNSLAKYIRERGYPCLNLLNNVGDIGLNLDIDFYNKNHTNLHGSVKFTDYLAKYLVNVYQFEDKRGKKGYESWDRAVELYDDIIGPYTFPFERSHAMQDHKIAVPAVSAQAAPEGQIRVEWSPVSGAEVYEIYRKGSSEGDRNWRLLAKAEGNMLSFTDVELSPGNTYTYTVVPIRFEDGNAYYGKFNYNGVSADYK